MGFANKMKQLLGKDLGVQPLGDRVVILPEAAPADLQKAGDLKLLYAPGTTVEPPSRGEIVAVGPGRTTDQGAFIPMGLRVGHVVMYGKYAGLEIQLEDETYIVMREPDVQLVLTKGRG